MHDIPVLDQVLLAFYTQFARLFDFLFRTVGKQILTMIHLSLDEALLEICMDHSGGLGCFGSLLECPGPVLVGTCGKKGTQTKRFVAGFNKPVQSRLFESSCLKEL